QGRCLRAPGYRRRVRRRDPRQLQRGCGPAADADTGPAGAAAGVSARAAAGPARRSAGAHAMSEEILVNVTPQETRVAMVENGVLQEINIERASRLGIVGNIYKGRVQRVLPGMQAAFVDIGLDRTGFLHASDIVRPDSDD